MFISLGVRSPAVSLCLCRPGRRHIFGYRPGAQGAPGDPWVRGQLRQLGGRGEGHALSVQPKELQLGVEIVCLVIMAERFFLPPHWQ